MAFVNSDAHERRGGGDWKTRGKLDDYVLHLQIIMLACMVMAKKRSMQVNCYMTEMSYRTI